MKHSLLLASCLALSTAAFADGTVTGKITDAKTSEPLVGVVVSVKGNATLGTATDIDGNFQLKMPAGKYELEIKYLGYQPKEVGDVEVRDEATVTLNSTLAEQKKSKDLGEVVVRATLKKENINSMILLQKTTNTVAQVVSAEAIRRSPDRNTGEVLKRVSGASIQDGKYLVVRGLADRYNAAMLNGALLASTEPDRKTFSFDLFPSAIVDNIVINKAPVPELPGEFAGGLVQVNTRDIPTEDFLNLQLGSGSNGQTIEKNFASNNVGGIDLLGIDDGTRGLPSGFPGNKSAFESQSVADRAAISSTFKNNFNISTNTAPLNAGGQLAGGLSRKLGKGRIGFVGALNYAKNNRITETQRYDFNDDGSTNYAYDEKRSQQNILWGALGNVAYTAGNNKISWKNLFSVNNNNQVTLREGLDNNGPYDVRAYELAFITNRFFSSQLSGEHLLKSTGVKLRWNGSYTNINQNIPDLRRVSYQREHGTNDSFEANVPQGSASLTSSGRFFSKLNDNVVSGSVDAARPFRLGGALHTVKVGYLVQAKNREFTPRALGYVADRTNPETNAMLHQDISTVFSAANIGTNKLYLNETTNPQDKYKANSLLNAGYVQFENQVLKNLQATWGVRVESYQQTINFANSIGKAQEKTTTVIDPLPSANLKYSLNDKTNLRLSGSQSVIRPEFRELAPFAFYNFELLSVEQGNSDLKRTKVTNADLRWEFYPAPGEFATAGVFYKYFQNPIEKFFNSTGAGSQSLEYGNTPSAYSYGVEAEFRKSLNFLDRKGNENGLLANTHLFSNVALIKNEVSFASGSTLKARPMQGQSNYVINAGISMDYKKTGSNFSLLVNRIGRRIFIVGNGVDQLNIWEAPRTLLDAQFTQRIFRNGEVKLSVSDILNQYARFYEDTDNSGKYEAGKDALRIQTRFGTNFGISFAYKFPHQKKQPVGAVTIP